MAIINGIRTVSNVVSGALTNATLQTYLGTAANRASWQAILQSPTQLKYLTSSTSGLNTVFGSVLAYTDALNTPEFSNYLRTRNPNYLNTISQALKVIIATNSTAIPILADKIYNANTVRLDAGSTPVINKVTFGNGIFVGVGYNSSTSSGYSCQSADGINWSWCAMPSGNWRNVTYANSVWVAVGDAGAVAVSSDAITWTRYNINTSSNLSSVTYGNSVFVAVSGTAGTTAWTSPDGITWTSRTMATSAVYNDVTYGNSLFVAVGTSQIINTSPDGITWTSRTSAITATLGAVIYGGTRFAIISVSNSTAQYSTDGITWTAATTPPGPVGANGAICYGNSTYAMFGATQAYTSTDASVWTARTWSNSTSYAKSIAYGNSIFVAIGVVGGFASSPTGTTWTARYAKIDGAVTANTSSNNRNIIWDGTRFILAGVAGNPWDGTNFMPTVFFSTDGKQFSSIKTSSGGSGNSPIGIASNGTTIMITNTTGNTYIYSLDSGVTWSTSTIPTITAGSAKPYYANGTWICIDSSSTTAPMISFDAINWQVTTGMGTASFRDIAYGNGFWVGLDTAANTYILPNGSKNWTVISSNGLVSAANYIAYGNGVFVALGSSTSIGASYDNGNTWTVKTNTAAFGISLGGNAISFVNGVFLCTGIISNAVYSFISVDGLNWTKISSTIYQNYIGVLGGNGQMMYGGNNVSAQFTSSL